MVGWDTKLGNILRDKKSPMYEKDIPFWTLCRVHYTCCWYSLGLCWATGSLSTSLALLWPSPWHMGTLGPCVPCLGHGESAAPEQVHRPRLHRCFQSKKAVDVALRQMWSHPWSWSEKQATNPAWYSLVCLYQTRCFTSSLSQPPLEVWSYSGQWGCLPLLSF